jgi:hypothetical protein
VDIVSTTIFTHCQNGTANPSGVADGLGAKLSSLVVFYPSLKKRSPTSSCCLTAATPITPPAVQVVQVATSSRLYPRLDLAPLPRSQGQTRSLTTSMRR